MSCSYKEHGAFSPVQYMIDKPSMSVSCDLGFLARPNYDLIDVILVGYVNNVFAWITPPDPKVRVTGNIIFVQNISDVIKVISNVMYGLYTWFTPARYG